MIPAELVDVTNDDSGQFSQQRRLRPTHTCTGYPPGCVRGEVQWGHVLQVLLNQHQEPVSVYTTDEIEVSGSNTRESDLKYTDRG